MIFPCDRCSQGPRPNRTCHSDLAQADQEISENSLDRPACESYILCETATFLRLACQEIDSRSPPPRKWRLVVLAATNLLLLFCLHLPVGAQVTIKDTIRIDEKGEITDAFNPCSFPAPDLFIVVPRNGVLRFRGALGDSMWGYEKFQLGSAPEMVLNQRLELIYSDTTITTSFSPIISSWTTEPGWSLASNHCIGSNLEQWYRGLLKLDTIYTRPLQTGDTLRFRFHANLTSNAQLISESTNGDQWLVQFYPDSTCFSIPPPPFYYCFFEENGGFYVEYADTSLRIVDHAPHEIWPLVPPTRRGTSRGADRSGYNPKRSFIIEVKDGTGQAVIGDTVKIKSQFIATTGGHAHNNPLLPDSLKGKFYAQGDSGNPVTLTTDSTGRAVVDSFIASQISGSYLVTAFLAADTTTRDTVQLAVRLPNLIDFAEIQSNFWTITGNTNPPGNCPGVTTVQHPSSHFATQKMSDSLQLGLLKFYVWSGSSKGGGQYIVLGINDMSLQSGGIFDICGDWNTVSRHTFHRVGLSVDIDNSGLKEFPDPVNQPNGVLTRRGRNLKTILESREIGGRMEVEPPIHFGFDRGR